MQEQKRSIQGRKLRFIEALFDDRNQLNIEMILKQHNVELAELRTWLEDYRFRQALQQRIRWAYTRSEIYLARYVLLAASRLIQLTSCPNEDVSRRACLDVLKLLTGRQKQTLIKHVSSRKDSSFEKPSAPDITFSGSTASKLLEVLANEQKEEAQDSA